MVSEFLISVTGVRGQPQFITWHPPSHVPLGNNALGRGNAPGRNNGTQASYEMRFWLANGTFTTCDNSVQDPVSLHDRPDSASNKSCMSSFSGHKILLPNAAIKDANNSIGQGQSLGIHFEEQTDSNRQEYNRQVTAIQE